MKAHLTTVVKFKDSINNHLAKNIFDENMNEHVYAAFDKIDSDAMEDSGSEDDVELRYSPYFDIFTGGFHECKENQIDQNAMVQQCNDLAENKQRSKNIHLNNDSDINNEKEHDRIQDVSNIVFCDSDDYTVSEECMEKNHKEAPIDRGRSEEDSSMDIDDDDKETNGNGEHKALQKNNNETHSNTILEYETADTLTNRKENDSSKENIVNSKYTNKEKVRNLHMLHNDCNELESDSGSSSNKCSKSLQDVNKDKDKMESNSNFSTDDLNESLHDDNVVEGGLLHFNCNICCKKYKYAEDFKNHMLTHGVNTFNCNQCGFATTNVIHHQQHMAKHETDIDENDTDTMEPNNTESTAFQCKIRGVRRENLDSHIKSQIKPYSCDNCDFSCYKRLQLKRHIMSHVCMKKKGIKKSFVLKQEFFKKSYKCDQCTFSCVYEKDFIQHSNSHMSGKPHNCHICDYATNNRKYLNGHIRSHIKSYKCLFCRFSFHRPSELSQHVIQKHTDHKPLKCKYCDYTCKVKKSLNIHLKIHRVKEIECEYCDFACTQNSDLIVHTFYKHREFCTANTFTCEECGKEFIKLTELRIHQNIHTKQYPNKCPECNYSCSKKDQLQSHINKIHGKKEKNVKCTKCDYACFTYSELKRHSVIHTDKRFFSCEHCEYVCRDKKTLKKHNLQEHNAECINPETKAKCSKCEYVAIDARELRRHSVVHTGDIFFTCEHCEYVCRAKKTLRKHALKEHNQESKEKCTKCEYIATSTVELKRHSVVHTGERFFTCEHCEYVCKLKRTLAVHELKQHSISDDKTKLKCEQSDNKCTNERSLETYQLKQQNIEKCKPKKDVLNSTVAIFFKETNTKDNLNELNDEDFMNDKKEISKAINTNSIKSAYFSGMKDVLKSEGLDNTKLYSCGKCEFVCIDNAEICQHLILKHENTDNELYKCEFCEYKSLERLDFLEHLSDHIICSSV